MSGCNRDAAPRRAVDDQHPVAGETRGTGSGAGAHLERTVEHRAGELRHLELEVVQRERPGEVVELVVEARDVRAGALDLAVDIDLAQAELPERQVERDARAERPLADDVHEELAELGADRRGLQEVQRVAHVAVGARPRHELRVLVVGHLGHRLADHEPGDPGAGAVDAEALVLELRLAGGVLDVAEAVLVVQADALVLEPHAEQPTAAAEREAARLAVELEARLRHVAGEEGVLEPAHRPRRDALRRQVLGRRARVDVGDVEIEHEARRLLAVGRQPQPPGAGRRAVRRMRAHAVGREPPAVGPPPPVECRGDGVGVDRTAQHLRQRQREPVRAQLHAPARAVGADVAVDGGDAGNGAPGAEGEPGEAQPAVDLPLVRAAAARRLEVDERQRAARAEREAGLADGARRQQRHERGERLEPDRGRAQRNAGQRPVPPVGAELELAVAPRVVAGIDGQVARRPRSSGRRRGRR